MSAAVDCDRRVRVVDKECVCVWEGGCGGGGVVVFEWTWGEQGKRTSMEPNVLQERWRREDWSQETENSKVPEKKSLSLQLDSFAFLRSFSR